MATFFFVSHTKTQMRIYCALLTDSDHLKLIRFTYFTVICYLLMHCSLRRISISMSPNCSSLTHAYSRSLPCILCAIVVQCWREPALQSRRYQTADKMLTKKTLESKRETAGAILAEQSRAAVEMSDSHSESLPKATIWSLKLHCMDNLLLCTRKKKRLLKT